MARRKSRKTRSKSRRGTTKRGKGQVPLDVLEKRLGKLNRIVLKRGGDGYK